MFEVEGGSMLMEVQKTFRINDIAFVGSGKTGAQRLLLALAGEDGNVCLLDTKVGCPVTLHQC